MPSRSAGAPGSIHLDPAAESPSLLGSVDRDGAGEPVFLLITPNRIEVHTLAWFSDHWSREAGYSRARRRHRLSFRILPPGSIHPQVFSVHDECHHGYAYAEGRRFLNCTATITTVPEHPADSPQHYRFRFWQHDPAADEPPVEDIETYPLPS
ncbi:hypothetical protein ACFV3R_10880 [Streptomyces sp. NPDC059740]|uniref:hypothetical protein n=1 Tax=Streptomyces sp. NPDC059740 TaxID=3346926 RepID=UPI0036532BE4